MYVALAIILIFSHFHVDHLIKAILLQNFSSVKQKVMLTYLFSNSWSNI